MAWKLRGTYVETCSCEFFCPCNFNLANGADYDRCRVTFVFNITDGDVDGTDVSGLAVVVIVDTPKVMTDGNWRLGTVIDGKASDEQAEKLQAVFSGELGGPMAALGPLIGENLGVQRAPIEVRDDGVQHSVRIGDQPVSMSRTSCPSVSRPVSPHESPASSIQPARNSVSLRRNRPTSACSASNTKASRVSAPRSSPGPPDGVTASAEGLRSVYAAARTRLGLIAVLFVLAVLAWWFTVDRMRGMDAGPGTELGTLAWFLGIWLVMMAAMMFPSVAPTVALYSTMTKTRQPGCAAGVCGRVSADVDGGRPAGLRFVRTGPSPLRRRIVLGSRGPLGVRWRPRGRRGVRTDAAEDRVSTALPQPTRFPPRSWRDGLPGALQMGAKHGAWCVGCCWALMASLFALGVMSIAWMAFVAALIAAEKTLPWGRLVTYGTAAILLTLGILIVVVPDAIPGLTIPGEGSTTEMDDMPPMPSIPGM